jgi:Family of unknown function (DUF5681)
MAKKPPRPPSRNYEVGKGRPPKATRWQPGQSGNPKGRPKGSKNAETMAQAELKRRVTVTVNGKKRRLTVADIAYRRLGDKSMGGDIKAFAFLLTLANPIDPSDAKPADNGTTPEQDLEIIAEYFKRRQSKSESNEQ